MDAFTLAAKLTLDSGDFNNGLGRAESAFSSFGGTMKKLLGGLAIGAAVKKTTDAVISITKSAVSAYANYEQLVGGVETLFGNSADLVQIYAKDAYKTAGVSANKYMETVTSFSASLLQSLGGDTEKAADVANMAMVDMSDNANKMGTDMAAIQNAYQGFAKQNYMMLDNLKLGYGGTKTEMQRLLKDAQKITKVKYDINNLADVYEAIHAIQTELGITGTTAKEAETTIAGSINMTKAAWEDFKVSLARGNVSEAMSRLIYSAKTAAKNVVPVVREVTKNIGVAMREFAPVISQELPGLIKDLMPGLVGAGGALIEGVIQSLPAIWEGAKSVINAGINSISTSLHESYPGIASAFDEIVKLANEAVNSVGEALGDIDYILSADNVIEGAGRAVEVIQQNWSNNPLSLYFQPTLPKDVELIKIDDLADIENIEQGLSDVTDKLSEVGDAIDEIKGKNPANVESNFTGNTPEKVGEANKKLSMLATAVSQDYDSSSKHTDNTSKFANEALEALSDLFGIPKDELKTYSEHIDGTSTNAEQALAAFMELFAYDKDNVLTYSEHDDTKASPIIVDLIAALNSYAAEYNGKTVAKTDSEHEDGVSKPVGEAEKSLDSISEYTGTVSSTDSEHEDGTSIPVKSAITELAALAAFLAEKGNSYKTSSEHTDDTTVNATSAFEAIAQLFGYTGAKDFFTSSEHKDDTSGPIEEVKKILEEYFEWNEENGTVTSNSKHTYAELSSALIAVIAILNGYKGDWDGKTVAKPKSEFEDGTTSEVNKVRTSLDTLENNYQGKFSDTKSEHKDGTSGPVGDAEKSLDSFKNTWDGKEFTTTSTFITRYVTEGNENALPTSAMGGAASGGIPYVPGGMINFDQFATKSLLHSRSMFGGSILRGATMFGYDEFGRPMVGGEAGPEAIVGVNSLQGMVRQAVADMMGQFPTAQEIAEAMSRVNLQVVTDTGALVGAIEGEMNGAMSRTSQWRGGGRA